MKRLGFILLLIAIIFPFIANSQIVLTTNAVTDKTSTTVTLNGTVESFDTFVNQIQFEYGEDTGYGTSIDGIPNITATPGASITASITGLTPGTEYHFRIFCTQPSAAQGLDVTFTTPSITSPFITTNDASDIIATSATLNGDITNDGGSSITERGFVWSTIDNPPTIDGSNTTQAVKSGTATGVYSKIASLLQENQLYYMQAYAINEIDTSYGGVKMLTTETQVNNITFDNTYETSIELSWNLGTATNVILVMKAESTVGGTPLNDNSYTADNDFSDGFTGDVIATNEYVVYNGTGTSITVSGLSPNTTYHFRAFGYENYTQTTYFLNEGTNNPNNTTTIASQPSSQATLAAFTSVAQNSMTINWTGGDGSSTIVAVRATDIGSSPTPADETNYPASSNYSSLDPDSHIGSSGYYVVYNGSDASATVTGLTANTTYYVEIFEYNGTSGIENYLVTHSGNLGNQTTLKDQPTLQANNISFDNIADDTMTANWIRGDVANTGVLVIARLGAEVADLPEDGTTYTASTVYGSGSAIGSGFVIFNGTETTVDISNLTNNTEYHFKAFEYNNSLTDEIDYLTTTSGITDNPNQQYTLATEPTQASSISFTNVDKTTMDISWTSQGDGSLVVVDEGSAVATHPSDANIYTANSNYGVGDALGTGYVAYNSTGNSFTLGNLLQDTTYHVRVYSYNNTPGVINYNIITGTNNPSSQQTASEDAPTTQASNITFTSVDSAKITINWDPGNGTKRIVAVRETDQGTITNPTDKVTYAASADWSDKGDLLGSGYYVVYNSDGESVTIDNLAANTAYYVQVFEYNGESGYEAYNINTAANNTETLNIVPQTNGTLSPSNIKFNSITVSSSGGNGEGRIIVANTANSFSARSDGTDYTGNSVYTSDEQVVYSGTSSSVIVTGLTEGTDYYFKSFEFNNTAPNTFYSTGSVVLSSTTGTGVATWEGDSGASWHTDANWSSGMEPTADEDVVIPSLTTQPEIGTNAYAKSVTIEAGAYLTINNGLLTVSNEILLETPNNSGMPGTIVIPDALGALTASTYTIERYILTANYHYFSPATSATTGSDFSQYWLYSYNEINAIGTPEPWENIGVSETLTPGKGYSIKKSTYSTPPDILTFNGSFNNGDKTVAVTNSAPGQVDATETYGWNIVGNPYPSTIDLFEANDNWTNIDGTIHVYNASSSGYTEYNTNTGVGPDQYIAPMQAFYVHVTTGQTSGNFRTYNSMRVAEDSPFKKSKADRQVVSLDLTNDIFNSETYFVFFEGATEGFDPEFDGYKLFGEDSIHEIYSLIGETNASINTFPIDTLSNLDVDGCTFHLGIKKGNATALTISIKQFENIPANVDVVLIDKMENNQVSLIDEDYSFSTLNMSDDSDTRFELIFIPTRIAVESISIFNDLETEFIQINKTLQYSSKILPETATNQTVVWSIDADSIGSIDVNSGLFSALSDGVATIKATANDGSGIFGEEQITVYTTIVLVDSLDIWHNGESDSLTQNSTMQFFAKTLPTNATNQTYLWSVDNPGIATIDASSGLLSAKKEGQITVTATSNDESAISESLTITIYLSTTSVSSISIESTESDSVEVNSNLQLVATVLPSNAANNTVTWASDDDRIAIINQTGLITGKSIGTAIITATANDGSGVTSEFSINVYNYTSIETNIVEKPVHFYPNPTSGILKLESNFTNCKYKIYNSLGSIVTQGVFSNKETINISSFENGVYYIEFTQNNMKQTELLIKSN